MKKRKSSKPSYLYVSGNPMIYPWFKKELWNIYLSSKPKKKK